jgi:hypothetical protein
VLKPAEQTPASIHYWMSLVADPLPPGVVNGFGVDEPVIFWMSNQQFELWKHTHLTVDVVPGRGSGFSLEAPEGARFLIRSRLLTPDEQAALA